MAYKNIKDARENDRRRSKDPKRRAQQAAWHKNARATDTVFKEKSKVSIKRWMKENHEENKVYRAEWAKKDRDAHREQYAQYEFAARLKKYVTTIEWYRDKLIDQLGVCALCFHLSYFRGKLQSLSVDHNHVCCDTKAKSCGKCNRGLLCNECNLKLSELEKVLREAKITPLPGTWTEKAMAYLAKYQELSLQRYVVSAGYFIGHNSLGPPIRLFNVKVPD